MNDHDDMMALAAILLGGVACFIALALNASRVVF